MNYEEYFKSLPWKLLCQKNNEIFFKLTNLLFFIVVRQFNQTIPANCQIVLKVEENFAQLRPQSN